MLAGCEISHFIELLLHQLDRLCNQRTLNVEALKSMAREDGVSPEVLALHTDLAMKICSIIRSIGTGVLRRAVYQTASVSETRKWEA